MEDAEQALELAYKHQEAGRDDEALRWAQKSLRLQDNQQAKVLVSWLERFGKGSEVDTEVRRVLKAPDFYAALGVARFCVPDADVHKRFLRLSRMLHPDKSGARRTEDACKRVNEAYTTLKDDAKRAKYDSRLRHQRPSAGGHTAPGAAAATGDGGSATEQLRRAVSAIPTVGELRWVLEKLGAHSNSRVRAKLIDEASDELARRAPLNRREGDTSGGFAWAFERLAAVRTEVSEAYSTLRKECMVACGAGSGIDVMGARDLLNAATDRSIDAEIVIKLEERLQRLKASEGAE
eukprot:6822267-Prymnesium_polylepis.1